MSDSYLLSYQEFINFQLGEPKTDSYGLELYDYVRSRYVLGVKPDIRLGCVLHAEPIVFYVVSSDEHFGAVC